MAKYLVVIKDAFNINNYSSNLDIIYISPDSLNLEKEEEIFHVYEEVQLENIPNTDEEKEEIIKPELNPSYETPAHFNIHVQECEAYQKIMHK